MLRFAPVVAGDMHTEQMRSALINYIISKQQHQNFALVLSDDIHEDETKEILKKFAVIPDLVIHQSDNLSRYQQLAASLVKQNKAFVCTCMTNECISDCINNQEQISSNIKEQDLPYLLRINKPQVAITIDDEVMGEITKTPQEIGDFILLHQDTTPSNDFASACDDMLMDISTIIQPNDYQESTIKQIHIKNSLAYDSSATYAHLPSFIQSDDKSHSIIWLLEQGYLPDAIINYLLQLSGKTEDEIFTLPDAIEQFDLKSISKTPPKFEIEQLRDINTQHIKQMDNKKLSTLFGFADESIGRLAKLYLTQSSTIEEIRANIERIFAPKKIDSNDLKQLQTISELIINADMFDTLDKLKEYLSKKSTMTSKELSSALHLLITGSQNSPNLDEIYSLIKPYITQIVKLEP